MSVNEENRNQEFFEKTHLALGTTLGSAFGFIPK
jgi:hypothetical protein